MIKNKIKLFAILLLYINTCFSQISHDEYRILLNSDEVLGHTLSVYEIKDISEVLCIKTEYFLIDTINQDTSAINNKIEYFDGEGDLEFFSGNDFDLDETRLWMKQYDKPLPYFNIYTNDVKEAHYTNKRLDDSTSVIGFYHPELRINTSVFLDSLGVIAESDSTYREFTFDARRNFSKTKTINKKLGISFFGHYEILNIDKRNNWTERIVTLKSGENTAKFQEIRQIKYSDEYKISKYFEIKVDTLIVNDQLIFNPEIFNPDLVDEDKVKLIEEDEKQEQQNLYKAISNLFHKKYFNNNYFMKFSATDEEVTEILKERLFKYLRSHVIDINNEKYYTGRTRSKRWFDHTASLKRLEESEDPPILTENWVYINGYKCREYVKKRINDEDEKFYVVEELQFINYCDFTFTLPGFIIKSTRHIPSIGEVELLVNINQCQYPFHFLEFLNELNEKHGTEIKYLQKKEN